MKHLTIIVLLFFGLAVQSFAQQDNRQREKMAILKIAYLTEELDLTKEQWQKFWPIYNDFHDTMEKKKLTGHLRELEEKDNMSADAKLEDILSKEEEALKLKKAYLREMKEATNAETVLKMMETERRFKQRLLKRYKGDKNRKEMQNERKQKMKQKEQGGGF